LVQVVGLVELGLSEITLRPQTLSNVVIDWIMLNRWKLGEGKDTYRLFAASGVP
jgi:hypothetical protein